MKRTILAGLLSLLALQSHAQGMYGFSAGLGRTMISKSYITPTLQAFYYFRLSRSFYLGAAAALQRFSFDTHTGNAKAYGDVLSIRQKTSYFYLSPKIDYGIGYRKYIHIAFSFGPGILLGGSQSSSTYEPLFITPGTNSYGSDTVKYNTTLNLPVLSSRFGLEVTERIPTLRYWNIILSQEFSFLPNNFSTHGPNLKTNYISFTVGIMHKYPQVLVEY
jgi:hypothetical protein